MSDLANELIRETFRPHTKLIKFSHRRSMEALRRVLMNSRRYVLDESMSSFLSHLSTVPFTASLERRPETLASLRHSARMPFDSMFIELDGHAFRRGLIDSSEKPEQKVDFWGNKLAEAEAVPKQIGYLLEKGIDGETIFITEFTRAPGFDELGVMTLPWRWAYRTDDMQFAPGSNYDVNSGFFGHGLTGVIDHSIAVIHDQEIPDKHRIRVESESRNLPAFITHALIPEFGGVVRYIICFLAALNDIPTIKTQVRPQKGYLARGQIRKYLEHTVLTLELPRKLTQRTLAKRLIARARLRWHEVEPHWRINKKPKGFLCEPSYTHMWSARDESGHSYCSECDARRVWIVLPHGRGDQSLGVVHHLERKVTHHE